MHDTIGRRGTCGLWILGRPYSLGGLLAVGLSLIPSFLGIELLYSNPLLPTKLSSQSLGLDLYFLVHWVLQNLSLMLCSIYHDCGNPCVHLEDYDVFMRPKCLQGCMLIFVQVRGRGLGSPQYSTDLAHEVTSHFRVAHALSYVLHRGNNVHVRNCAWSRSRVDPQRRTDSSASVSVREMLTTHFCWFMPFLILSP